MDDPGMDDPVNPDLGAGPDPPAGKQSGSDDGLVPIGWIAAGDPAVILPPEQHDKIWETQRQPDFPGTVFGVARDTPQVQAAASRRYAELFGVHRSDRPVAGP